jgi:hypothetical protein
LQKHLTSVASIVAHQKVLDDIRADGTDQKAGVCEKSDVVAAFTPSQQSRVFQVDLTNKYCVMVPMEFIVWALWFLRMPPIPRFNALVVNKAFGYMVERCMGNHAKGHAAYLDLHGNHANSTCKSAKKALGARHTGQKRVVYFHGRLAGVQAEMEPDTKAVLLNQYTAKQCRAIAPKQPTNAQKLAAEDLTKHLGGKDPMRTETKDEERITEQKFRQLASLAKPYQKFVGQRVDVWLRDYRTGEEALVDTTATHPNCESLRELEFKRVIENVAAGMNPASRSEAKQKKRFEGRAVQCATKRKHTLYAPLMTLASKQAVDGRRKKAPRFFAAACSTLGEWGQDMFALQEWLVHAYALKLEEEGPQDDGSSIAKLTAAFRNSFRNCMYVAVASGVARQLLESGLP